LSLRESVLAHMQALFGVHSILACSVLPEVHELLALAYFCLDARRQSDSVSEIYAAITKGE
jgi:hypothetical protein